MSAPPFDPEVIAGNLVLKLRSIEGKPKVLLLTEQNAFDLQKILTAFIETGKVPEHPSSHVQPKAVVGKA